MIIQTCTFTQQEIETAIALGQAVQGFVFSNDQSKIVEFMAETGLEKIVDCYFTSRNGDTVCMFVPRGTPIEKLPKHAMDYVVRHWERI